MSLRDYFTQTLKKDEAVVAVVRKHWITVAPHIALVLIVLGVLIGFVDFFFSNEIGSYVWLGLVAVVSFYGFYHWIVYYFDSIIVTDYRIIDIDQNGLFKRTVSETTFDRVQDVTYSIVGFMATALDFGTVTVATASANAKIELDHVPHPRKVHEVLLEAQKLFKQRYASDMSAEQLIELIAKVKPKSGVAKKRRPTPPPDEETEGGDSEESEV